MHYTFVWLVTKEENCCFSRCNESNLKACNTQSDIDVSKDSIEIFSSKPNVKVIGYKRTVQANKIYQSF